MKRVLNYVLLLMMSVGCLVGANSVIITAEPAIPGVLLHYEENAQIELISPSGVRVLVDVHDPFKLSTPATSKDILLTTHSHPDHLVDNFQYTFPGQQLFKKAGEISVSDTKITGIASSHDSSPIYPEFPSNYIYIIEMGGLRIAHFGDIGQNALSPEQLAKLGQIDIAITQFYNGYSFMDLVNKKGFNLMSQVKPKVIIPTHSGVPETKYAMTLWKCFYSEKPTLLFKQNLDIKETQFILLGNTVQYVKGLGLSESSFKN